MNYDALREEKKKVVEKIIDLQFPTALNVLKKWAVAKLTHEIMSAFLDGKKEGLEAWQQFIDKGKVA